MKRLRWGFPGTLLLGKFVLAVAFCHPASAETPPARPAAHTEDRNAAVLYKQGAAARDKEDWEAARTYFLAAWQLKKHYQIAANLGWAEFMLGRYRDAAEHLAYFFREVPPGGVSPQERSKLQALLEQAGARSGAVIIRVDVPGADVFVNGNSIGRAPLSDPVFVEPGRIEIEARKPGYPRTEMSREVTPGSTTVMQLRMIRPPKHPPAAVRAPIPTGTERRRTALIVSGALLSAAGAGVGIGTAVASASAAERKGALEAGRCDSQCMKEHGTPQKAHDAADRARVAYANASFWSLLGAGAVGVGTAVYAVTTSGSKANDGARASISVSTRGTGLFVTGTF